MQVGVLEVVGADGCRGGWVAVTLREGKLAGAARFARFESLLEASARASVIGVDIPIGLLESGTRAADREARRRLGRAGSSVFPIPARPVLAAPTYTEARRLAASLGEPGVTSQAFHLRDKIFEVAAFAAGDRRLREVHPELSFRALAGRPLRAGKKTWDGLCERRALLLRAGLDLPDALGEAGKAGPDDVLDAAAAAWSALRIARGQALCLPDPPESAPEGYDIAIWY